MHAPELQVATDPSSGTNGMCMPVQDSSGNSCLRGMPSQRVQSGLIGVMSGARDGNLDHQVRGEPESIAGTGAPLRQSGSLGSSGQRVGILLMSAIPGHTEVCWTSDVSVYNPGQQLATTAV